MASKTREQIEKLEARLKQLKVQQARLEARRRQQQAAQARRDDTRRQILVGTLILERVRAGQFPETELKRWLDAALSRPSDRALFDLSDASVDGKPPGDDPTNRVR